MNGVNNHWEDTPRAIGNQTLEMSNRLLLRHLQMEPIADLDNRLVGLHPDIGDIGIHHQSKKVENQVAGLA